MMGAVGGIGWNPGSRRNCRILLCSIEVFLCFGFGGLAESEKSLCFLRDGNFGTAHNLASLAGKADEALVTSLIKKMLSVIQASILHKLYIFISICLSTNFLVTLS